MADTFERIVTQIEVEGLGIYDDLASKSIAGAKALRSLNSALRAFDKAAKPAVEGAGALDKALGEVASAGLERLKLGSESARTEVRALVKDLKDLSSASTKGLDKLALPGAGDGPGKVLDGLSGKAAKAGKSTSDAAGGVDELVKSLRDLDGPGEVAANKLEAIGVLASGPVGLALGALVVSASLVAGAFTAGAEALDTWTKETVRGAASAEVLAESYEKLQISSVELAGNVVDAGDLMLGASKAMDTVRGAADGADSALASLTGQSDLLGVAFRAATRVTVPWLGVLVDTAHVGEQARAELLDLEGGLTSVAGAFDVASDAAGDFGAALSSGIGAGVESAKALLTDLGAAMGIYSALPFEVQRDIQAHTLPGGVEISGPLTREGGLIGQREKKKGGGGGGRKKDPLAEIMDPALTRLSVPDLDADKLLGEEFVPNMEAATTAIEAMQEAFSQGALFGGELSPIQQAEADAARLNEQFSITAEKLKGVSWESKVWGDVLSDVAVMGIEAAQGIGLEVASTLGQFAAGGGTIKEFGDSILDAFGSLAAQLGQFFVATGTAMLFMPGGVGQGLGLIAGGLALGVLGGALGEKGSGNRKGAGRGRASGASADDVTRTAELLRPRRDDRQNVTNIRVVILDTEIEDPLVEFIDGLARRNRLRNFVTQ